MAEALLPFAVERLWNLLVRETERFQGVGEQFHGLKRDVRRLRCFLEDADAKKHTSATVRDAIMEIKEIVLDAEDIIDTFLLKEGLRNKSGIRNTVRRFSCVSLERRRLASDIETLSRRITKEIQHMHSFGVQERIVSESRKPPQDEQRQTFSTVDEKDPLVGMEKNIETLVGYLVKEDSSRVVSITGMGGIGKTTLARQVFNHETIKIHFPGLAWVCVSQQFTREYVSREILKQLRPEIKVFEMTDNVLEENLVQVLKTQKSLIVIDDIWSEGDWDQIKHVSLPKKGWKVLLTSRKEGVGLHADRHCVTFKPECLNFEDSWDLFQMIAFPMEDTAEFKVDEKMEEVGKQMIKCCGGLPLAVKVLGGLLAAEDRLHEWERIYENIKTLIVRGAGSDDRNSKSVYDVLYLSYKELPAYLKHCFLYLAHFPEDYQIDVEDLSYYWATEEISRPMYYDGASIRDVADRYIAELVKRNMVISERDVDTSRFEKCQLHDMMREVCLHKAEEDNFVQIIQGTSTANHESPGKFRRLAVHRPDKTINGEKEVTNASLRTLLFIKNMRWKVTSLFFKRHKLMRVLDLSGVEFEGGKLPSSIGKLIHLRYLSLKWASVTHLPSSMRNLKQLLYLNLLVDSKFPVYMPNILKEMRELTYLCLPERLHDKVKMELGNLVKLETLKNFSTEHGSVSDLQGMTKLRILSIHIRGKGCSMKTLSSSLSKITHLENLTINNLKRHALTNDDEEGFVLDSFHLRQLKLKIYMPRLPDPQHFPSHLTKIHLAQCRLEKDPMPILEKLEQLKEVNLYDESFNGRRMVCSRGGFPQLMELIFNGLKEWEEWIVEEGSMPLLRTLYIGNCGKLKEIPHGLRFITSLENLNVSLRGEECKMILSEQYLHSRLTGIHLTDCRFEEDPMPILEKLLYLKQIDLIGISFGGNRMVCSRGGFPQLKAIWFYELKEWEEWIVEDGSMPLLHTLVISRCKKLKELPDGLRFITSLEYLACDGMGEEWKKRLSKGGEDYYKVQHIPSVQFK